MRSLFEERRAVLYLKLVKLSVCIFYKSSSVVISLVVSDGNITLRYSIRTRSSSF